MNIINSIYKLFSNTTTNNSSKNIIDKETYIDIVISLSTDKKIDFSVFLDDKIENIPINIIDYSILCAEFFHSVLSNKTKNDTVEVLEKQIRNKDNSLLVDNIVSVIKILDKQNTKNTFIKPSEVFSKYLT